MIPFLYKKPNNNYYIIYEDLNGRRRSKSTLTDKKEDAEKQLDLAAKDYENLLGFSSGNKKFLQGNIGLTMAIAYYTQKFFIISVPLNDIQPYDLIIEKNGVIKTVQIKTTSFVNPKKRCYEIKFSKHYKGKPVYLDKNRVDRLFVYCANGDIYDLPMNILGKSHVTLNNSKINFKERVVWGLKETNNSIPSQNQEEHSQC